MGKCIFHSFEQTVMGRIFIVPYKVKILLLQANVAASKKIKKTCSGTEQKGLDFALIKQRAFLYIAFGFHTTFNRSARNL